MDFAAQQHDQESDHGDAKRQVRNMLGSNGTDGGTEAESAT
jgi:hypothetical protein